MCLIHSATAALLPMETKAPFQGVHTTGPAMLETAINFSHCTICRYFADIHTHIYNKILSLYYSNMTKRDSS